MFPFFMPCTQTHRAVTDSKSTLSRQSYFTFTLPKSTEPGPLCLGAAVSRTKTRWDRRRGAGRAKLEARLGTSDSQILRTNDSKPNLLPRCLSWPSAARDSRRGIRPTRVGTSAMAFNGIY